MGDLLPFFFGEFGAHASLHFWDATTAYDQASTVLYQAGPSGATARCIIVDSAVPLEPDALATVTLAEGFSSDMPSFPSVEKDGSEDGDYGNDAGNDKTTASRFESPPYTRITIPIVAHKTLTTVSHTYTASCCIDAPIGFTAGQHVAALLPVQEEICDRARRWVEGSDRLSGLLCFTGPVSSTTTPPPPPPMGTDHGVEASLPTELSSWLSASTSPFGPHDGYWVGFATAAMNHTVDDLSLNVARLNAAALDWGRWQHTGALSDIAETVLAASALFQRDSSGSMNLGGTCPLDSGAATIPAVAAATAVAVDTFLLPHKHLHGPLLGGKRSSDAADITEILSTLVPCPSACMLDCRVGLPLALPASADTVPGSTDDIHLYRLLCTNPLFARSWQSLGFGFRSSAHQSLHGQLSVFRSSSLLAGSSQSSLRQSSTMSMSNGQKVPWKDAAVLPRADVVSLYNRRPNCSDSRFYAFPADYEFYSSFPTGLFGNLSPPEAIRGTGTTRTTPVGAHWFSPASTNGMWRALARQAGKVPRSSLSNYLKIDSDDWLEAVNSVASLADNFEDDYDDESSDISD